MSENKYGQSTRSHTTFNNTNNLLVKEMLEGIKGVSKSRKSKDRQHNGKTIIYKTLRSKQKLEQHEPHKNPWVNSDDLNGYAVSVLLVTHVVLLLNGTNIT